MSTAILIPVHDQLNYLLQCLASIPHPAPPVYILNDGSGPEMNKWCTDATKYGMTFASQVNILSWAPAKGFSYAANWGLDNIKADLYVILNSDTIIGTQDWIARFEEVAQDPKVGIMSCVSNYACYQSIPNIPGGSEVDPSLVPLWTHIVEAFTEKRRPDMNLLNGFCYAIKREVIDDVGKFDVINFPHYGSEDDLTLRAKRKGWKTICLDDVYVWHKGSQSYSANRAHYVRQAMTQLERQHSRILIRDKTKDCGRELDYLRQKIRGLAK